MEEWSPTKLVVCSGNTSAAAIVGCIAALEKKGMLSEIKQYSSSGNGCLFTVLLNLGCDTREIDKLLSAEDDSFFFDSHSYQHRPNPNFQAMRQFLDIGVFFSKVFTKKLTIVPTFRQLYFNTGKTLYLSTYNLSRGECEYLSYKTHPNMNVITAIRLSLGAQSLNSNLSYDGDSYVDAALANPLPVSCFDHKTKILALRSRWNQPLVREIPYSQQKYSCLLLDIASEVLTKRSKRSCMGELLLVTLKLDEDTDSNFHIELLKGHEDTMLFFERMEKKEAKRRNGGQ